jgi:hypothetical protein
VCHRRITQREPFFSLIAQTHSHPGNIDNIEHRADGEIGATCVDCVTHAIFTRYTPRLAAATLRAGDHAAKPLDICYLS